MSKFNRAAAQAAARGPTTTVGRTRTYEGGAAHVRDTRSELVLLAVVNMVGEDTFYEAATDRDERFRRLVSDVALDEDGADWLTAFIRWLRTGANMRSASVVAAAEAVKARLDVGLHGGNRALIDAALARADEPGELLSYWTSRYGRAVPKPVKRGVGDAARRLYHQRSLLKYDSDVRGYRFADVLELTHPSPDPAKPWQGELFKHAIDRRHGRGDAVPESLGVLRARAALMAVPVADRRAVVERDDAAEVLRAAGMTWESLAGWLQGPMDARAWTVMLPSMGYMARLRNLRNLDEAGVDDAVAGRLAAELADPENVAASRQFPFRFLSAYRAAPSLRWGAALEKALAASTANVPALPGRTLVLVDTSASMTGGVSARSTVRHVDVGALFGVALAARGADVDLVGFASGSFRHALKPGGSVLKQVDAFCARIGEVGHGTETVAAIRKHFRKHDRVVVVSDMQAFRPWGGRADVSVSDAVPADVPMFGIDTTGYSKASIDAGAPLRYEVGGFSDKLFTLVARLSAGRDASWPWA